MRIKLNDLLDAQNRIRIFIGAKRRLPGYCNMRDMDTKKMIKISQESYCGIFYTAYNFWLKNGRLPNYVTMNVKKSEPTIQVFQDNKYNCCPASLSMISTKLFKPKSEKKLAKTLRTGKNGTPPENLMRYAPLAGFKVIRKNRDPNEVQKALNEYKGVMIHYQTKAATCGGWLNDYGHYAIILGIKGGKYLISDPTKGYYECRTDIMDKATNGRKLYYYVIS